MEVKGKHPNINVLIRIDFERTSSFVSSKHTKSKKNHENSSRNKDFRVIFKNAGPKGSPGFERVLRGYFFQKTGFAVRHDFSSILMLETSNKLQCVGNQ